MLLGLYNTELSEIYQGIDNGKKDKLQSTLKIMFSYSAAICTQSLSRTPAT